MEHGVGGKGAHHRSKVSDRVALLKKALAGETAAAHKVATAAAAAGMGGRPVLALAAVEVATECAPTAEDEDAISALFELSSSVC